MSTALIAPLPKFRYTDNNGLPLAGGQVFTYASGTTNPATTFTDATGNTANTNPVVLNSIGEANIFLSPVTAYRFVVKTSAGATLATTDGIYGVSSGNSLTVGSLIGTAGYLASDTDGTLAANSDSRLATQKAVKYYVDNLGKSFQQSGTSSVLRTYDARLKESVSAFDFGAKGDGATDDTAALQAAINFVQSHTNIGSSVSPNLGPQILFVPAGYYLISAPLTITGSITILGEKTAEYSSGTRFHKTTAGDLFTCTAAGGGLSFSIERIAMDSTGVAGTGYLVNMVSGAQNHNSSRLIGCTFANPQNFAIKATADDLHIDGCTFDVSPYNCIQLGSSAGGDICSDLLVTNSNFFNITNTVFLAYSYRNVRIVGCQVSNPTTPVYTAKFFDAATQSPTLAIGLSITGCVMDFVRQILALKGTSNTTFVGNSCYGTGSGAGETLDAILCTNNNVDLVIAGNVISGSLGSMSLLNNTGGAGLNAVIVSGNAFRSSGAVGPCLTLGAAVGRVTGNYYNGFTSSVTASDLLAIGYENRAENIPTFSGAITIDCAAGTDVIINVTSTSAFGINAPTNPSVGQVLKICVFNNSGGVMGTVSWNPVFRMAAFTNPSNLHQQTVSFVYSINFSGGWKEISRTPAEVPI